MASWVAVLMRGTAAIHVSSMLPCCDVRIYRVCKMALHEASAGRHGVLLEMAMMLRLERPPSDGRLRLLVSSAMWQDARNDDA